MARTYGGVNHEQRRAVRRAALIAAGLDLLGGSGMQATSVRAVCARAGLTSRYFYESFADLDGLLLAVFDSLAAEVARAVVSASAAAPAEARAKARAAIAAFVTLIVEDPRKARVLFVEARGSEALERRRFEALHGMAAIVAAQGREFYGLTTGDRLADVTAFMLVGGLSETLMAWLDGTLQATQEELVEDCTDLFVATGEGAVALARARARRV
jgi:AcrR family transcriptional regulator